MSAILTKLVISDRCAIAADGTVYCASACVVEGDTLYVHGGASEQRRFTYRVSAGVRFSSIVCRSFDAVRIAVCGNFLAANMSITISGRAILMLPSITFDRLCLQTSDNAQFVGTDGATRAKTTHICSTDGSFVCGLTLTSMASIEAEQSSRVYVTAASPDLIETSQHPLASVLIGQFVDTTHGDPAEHFVHNSSWTAAPDTLPMIESF